MGLSLLVCVIAFNLWSVWLWNRTGGIWGNGPLVAALVAVLLAPFWFFLAVFMVPLKLWDLHRYGPLTRDHPTGNTWEK